MKIEEFIEDNKKNIKHTLEPKDLAVLIQEKTTDKEEVMCAHFYIYIIEITRNIFKNIGEWWNVTFCPINSINWFPPSPTSLDSS